MTEEGAKSDQYAREAIRERLGVVRSNIRAAREAAGRDRESVKLVAVGKTHPVGALREVYEAGVRHFGASYVQEWQEKRPELPDDIEWHFVGHLQSNKAKYVADEVAMVHSIDRRSVMKQMHRRSETSADVLLQVNIAEEESKSGVIPGELPELLEMTMEYPNLRVRGLMTLPPHPEEPEDNRGYFRRMRELFAESRDWIERTDERDAEVFEHLSMGMTNDYRVAVEEGATIVRIGTALFGPRDYE